MPIVWAQKLGAKCVHTVGTIRGVNVRRPPKSPHRFACFFVVFSWLWSWFGFWVRQVRVELEVRSEGNGASDQWQMILYNRDFLWYVPGDWEYQGSVFVHR